MGCVRGCGKFAELFCALLKQVSGLVSHKAEKLNMNIVTKSKLGDEVSQRIHHELITADFDFAGRLGPTAFQAQLVPSRSACYGALFNRRPRVSPDIQFSTC